MAQPPLTFLEKRWLGGYGSGNALVQAATQNNDRQTVPFLDYDVYRNVSTVGRRTLMTLGRFLYENSSPIGGSVDEIARLTASSYLPQFEGQNKAWGEQAEQLLSDGDGFIDVRGWPFSMDTYRRNLIISILRDGETGVLLTEVDGEPKLQVIPSHRIGSRFSSGNFTTIINDPNSRFDGAKLIDGVIVDDYGAALGYRIYDELGINYVEVSANDFVLIFIPNYPEQLRGFSRVGKVAWEAFDVKESRDFELIAQKLRATYPVAITNETGYADPTKAIFGTKTIANDATTNAAKSLPTQAVNPGNTLYFRAGKGEKIEFPENNNPGANVMEFQREILRSFLQGIGWSFDMYDPTKAGGAQMRVVIEKVNAAIAELQDLALKPTLRRITGWRVSKHIKAGRLPDEKEWFRWGFQGPSEVTADEGYSSDVIIKETRAGLRSPQKGIERLGSNWEKVQDDAIEFERRFQEKCAAAKVDPNRVILLTPNGNPVQQPQQGQDQTPSEDKNK